MKKAVENMKIILKYDTSEEEISNEDNDIKGEREKLIKIILH